VTRSHFANTLFFKTVGEPLFCPLCRSMDLTVSVIASGWMVCQCDDCGTIFTVPLQHRETDPAGEEH
jgi:hypothetical protein